MDAIHNTFGLLRTAWCFDTQAVGHPSPTRGTYLEG